MPSYQGAVLRVGNSRRRTVRQTKKPAIPAGTCARPRAPAGMEGKHLAEEGKVTRLAWPIILLLVSFIVPWVISLGPVRLSLYRIVLIVMTVPCLVQFVSGKAGRVRLPDVAVILFGLWAGLCLAVVHGPTTAVQGGSITFIETVGSYMIARCYIRTEDDFENMVSLMFKIIVFILLPFGIIEMVTGYKPLLKVFGTIMPVIDVTMMDRRWEFWRVQGPYEHPLLFGVNCGAAYGLTHLVLGHRRPLSQRWLRTALVGLTVMLCLSSGPLSALVVQTALIGWNWLLSAVKSRWALLSLALAILYVGIYLYSGQSVARFYISHAPLFDSWSAYYRILIWENGTATVANHPIFGIGYNEYERPSWMAASVDIFWLNNAIMFGLPGGLLVITTLVSAVTLVALRQGSDARTDNYRSGYIISMAGFFVVGCTVFFWNGTYSLFFFLVASGLWLAETPEGTQSGRPVTARAGRLTKAAGIEGNDNDGVQTASRTTPRRQTRAP
jgi:hypothetical protein